MPETQLPRLKPPHIKGQSPVELLLSGLPLSPAHPLPDGCFYHNILYHYGYIKMSQLQKQPKKH